VKKLVVLITIYNLWFAHLDQRFALIHIDRDKQHKRGFLITVMLVVFKFEL